MSDILVTEEFESRKNGVGSSLAEAAERILLDVVSQLLKSVDILEGTLAVGDLLKQLHHALGADTAGGALTAGFVDGEVQEELRDIDHAVVLVHDDEAARTHHAADGGEVIVIYLSVYKACGDTAAGGSAGLSSLELLAVRHAAADILDDLSEGGAHRDLNKAGVDYLAAEREDLGAL